MAELQASAELAPVVQSPTSDGPTDAELTRQLETPAPFADSRAAGDTDRDDTPVPNLPDANKALNRALELNSNPLEPDVLEAVAACLKSCRKSGADAQQIPALNQWRTKLTKERGAGALIGAENTWASQAFGFDVNAVQNLLDSRTLNLRNPEVANNVREITGRRFFSGYSLGVVSTLLDRNANQDQGLLPPERDVLEAWNESVDTHLASVSTDDASTVDELLTNWCKNGEDELWRSPRATLIEVSSILGVRSPRD
jgi:hypothetical protein